MARPPSDDRGTPAKPGRFDRPAQRPGRRPEADAPAGGSRGPGERGPGGPRGGGANPSGGNASGGGYGGQGGGPRGGGAGYGGGGAGSGGRSYGGRDQGQRRDDRGPRDAIAQHAPRYGDAQGDNQAAEFTARTGRVAPPVDLVTGVHAALALLQHKAQRVREVLLWSRDPRVQAQVRQAAAAARVPVIDKEMPAFDDDPGNPQGVALRVTEFAYTDLDTLVPETGCPRGTLILVLDSITDPRNLGAILRSAAFFGVQAVVIPQDRAAGVTPLVERISRGATAIVPVVRVVNLARTLQILQDRGVFVVGTGLEPGCGDLATHSFDAVTALVLGAEGGGLRPLVRKRCDIVAKLSGIGDMQSLNVSAFATLALHLARAQVGLPSAEQAPI